MGRGSPLSGGREIGKRGPSVREGLTQAVTNARNEAVRTGEVQKIKLGGIRISVDDTDIISDVVEQVLKDLNLG